MQTLITDFTWEPFDRPDPPPPDKLVSIPFGPASCRFQAVLLLSESGNLAVYLRPVKSQAETSIPDSWSRLISNVEMNLLFSQSSLLASASFSQDEILGFSGPQSTGFGVPDLCTLDASLDLSLISLWIRISLFDHLPVDSVYSKF